MNYSAIIATMSVTQNGTADGSDGSNDYRLKDFLKKVGELGRDKALGEDSLPKLAMRVVQAASDGIIQPQTQKGVEDDSLRIYKAYIEAKSNKAIYAHKADGLRANASKVRQFTTLGCLTHVEPMEIIEKAAGMHKDLMGRGEKVRPPYHALLEVARLQNRTDRALTDEEIKDCILQQSKERTKDVETVLRDLVKRVEDLASGEKGVKDQSAEVLDAYELLKKRLGAVLAPASDADEEEEETGDAGETEQAEDAYQ